MTTPRDKAIQTIAKLRRVAEHPNTGKPEADAARARIEALRVKHQITASPPPRAKVPYSDSTDWNKAADAAKKAADAARIMADAIRHADAAKKYREKMQNRDSMGRPFPKSGDIFDEAIRNSGDTRTTAERNKDVQNSFRRLQDSAMQRTRRSSTTRVASLVNATSTPCLVSVVVERYSLAMAQSCRWAFSGRRGVVRGRLVLVRSGSDQQ